MNINLTNHSSNIIAEEFLKKVRKITEVLMESDVPDEIIEQIIDPIINMLIKEQPSNCDIYNLVSEKMISMIGGNITNSIIPNNAIKKEHNTRIIIFAGPNGYGKTTTMLKVAINVLLNLKKKIVFVGGISFKAGVHDRLRSAADILGVNLTIMYKVDELKTIIKNNLDVDYIFVDTTGSFNDKDTITELKGIMTSNYGILPELILIIPASIKTSIALNFVNFFAPLKPSGIIFTKTDETDSLGTIFTVAAVSNIPIKNLCNGQNIPDDIISFSTEHIVNSILNSKHNKKYHNLITSITKL